MAPFQQASLFALLRLALEELVINHRFPSGPLFKALLSRGLGYGILAGSTMVKIPQIIAVLKAGSAEGLSPLSIELETLGYCISAAYGFLLGLPFSAYGEVVGILAQNLVLMVLVYSLQRHPWPRRGLCFLLLAGWAGAVLSGAVTRHAISAVFDLNNMLFIASRVPQILQNFSTGSTGTLSPITYGLNAAGGAARIFTSLHEKAGAAMVRGAMLGAALNAVVLAQIAAYRGRRGAERVKTE